MIPKTTSASALSLASFIAAGSYRLRGLGDAERALDRLAVERLRAARPRLRSLNASATSSALGAAVGARLKHARQALETRLGQERPAAPLPELTLAEQSMSVAV